MARRGMEQRDRRLRLPSSHRGCQDLTDRQASCTSRLQGGVGREEGGPSDRRGRKGSVYLGSASFTNNLSPGAVKPESGPGDTGGRRGLSQQSLHSAQDGEGKGVWQTLHLKPQSESSPYFLGIGAR